MSGGELSQLKKKIDVGRPRSLWIAPFPRQAVLLLAVDSCLGRASHFALEEGCNKLFIPQ